MIDKLGTVHQPVDRACAFDFRGRPVIKEGARLPRRRRQSDQIKRSAAEELSIAAELRRQYPDFLQLAVDRLIDVVVLRQLDPLESRLFGKDGGGDRFKNAFVADQDGRFTLSG